MAELRPHPFGALVRRMLREAEREAKIFDLPLSSGYAGAPDGLDLGVRFHAGEAGTALGPAAGPQSQMAQNLVLSWLVGCRVMELKTVQVLDQLQIPRPCIDMASVGYNVEWSQELRLEQSLVEYAKGSMLIEVLRASGLVPAQVARGAAAGDVIFDMSVGYDLAGVQSSGVREFIAGMQDASAIVERLRLELLSSEMADVLRDYPQLADLEFTTCLSNTLTLSTFHGCPPDEIEGIAGFLMKSCGLDVVVKLNPTLLGPARVRELLGDVMGYTDIVVPTAAFEADMSWDDMLAIVGRLGPLAQALGRGFGVKFTNTQIVSNHRDFFPSAEERMYLSGAPLHVLAMELVGRFREVFGARYPISFSAGIDRGNFADSVALGLVPVTVCTDLLRPGGYARATKYLDALVARMLEVGASCIDEFVILAMGHGKEALNRALERCSAPSGSPRAACEAALEAHSDLRGAAGPELFEGWCQQAALLNTKAYVAEVSRNPRYSASKNSRVPKKIGSSLVLLDCTTCDKCVPVCPNNANFVFVLPRLEVPILKLRLEPDGWHARQDGRLVIEKRQQYANYADFCNECGNCDVFCPEDGGPYVVKPRFFGNARDWRAFADQNGFVMQPEGGVLLGRIAGREFELEPDGSRVAFRGAHFDVQLVPSRPLETIAGRCSPGEEVDLAYLHIMIWMRDGVFGSDRVNYLNAGAQRHCTPSA